MNYVKALISLFIISSYSAGCASVQKPTLVSAVDSDNLSYQYCAKVQSSVDGVTNYSLACDTVPGVFAKHQESK